MKPLKLTIENIGSYKERTVIDFQKFGDRGLFLIHGETGSGKTTIFDAICLALYNSTSNDRDEKKILSDYNKANGKNTDNGLIEYEFLLKNIIYTISRYYDEDGLDYTIISKDENGTITYMAKDGSFTEKKPTSSKCPSQKVINQFIKSILGINLDQFQKVAMLSQGKFRELIDSTDSSLKNILASIFKTEKYGAFCKAINAHAKNLVEKRKEANQNIEATYKDVNIDDEYKYSLLQKTTDNDKLEFIEHINQTYNQKLEDEKESRKKVQEKLNDTIAKIEKCKTANQSFESLNYTENKMLTYFENEKACDIAENELNSVDRAKNVCTAAERLETAESTLEKHKDNLKKTVEEKNKTNIELNKAKSNLEDIKEKNEPLKTKASNEIIRLAEAKKEFENKDKLVDLKNKTEVQIKQKETLLDKNKSRIEEINSKINEILKENEVLESASDELADVENKIRDAKTEKSETIKLLDSFSDYEKRKKSFNESEIEVRQAFEKFKQANNNYTNALGNYLDNIADRLAQELKDNEPCPVCGICATHEQRRKPKEIGNTTTAEDVDKLKKIQATVQNELDEKKSDFEMKKGTINGILLNMTKIANSVLKTNITIGMENATDVLSDVNVLKTDIENNLRSLQKDKKITEDKIEKYNQNNNIIKNSKEEIENIKNNNTVIEREINNLKINLTQITTNLEKIEENIAKTGVNSIKDAVEKEKELEKYIDSLNVEIANANNKVAELNNKSGIHNGKIKTLENNIFDAENNINRLKTELEKSLIENDFENTQAATAVFTSLNHLLENKVLRNNIAEYKALSIKKKSLIEQIEKSDIKEKTDISSLERESENLQKLIDKNDGIIENLRDKIKDNVKVINKVKSHLEEFEELNKKYNAIERIYQVTNRKSTFEMYVQAYYLNKILDKANIRLSKMTNGNFRLRLPEYENTENIQLYVHDASTNSNRLAKTLSGGESFKAALSLALGMSDQIQNSNTNVDIQTVFVDEGFGSLDDESRKQAINVLLSMAKDENVTVGIISHVTELKNMIDRQIVVTKDNNGSHAEIKFGTTEV